MDYSDKYELLEKIKEDLDELENMCDQLKEVDITELQKNLKLLWKHRGRHDRTINADNIKDIIKELDILFDVSHDVSAIDEIRNTDLDDFGVVEPESW